MTVPKTLLRNPKTFLDISIAGEASGRLEFELYADKLPITAENFRALCTDNSIFDSFLSPFFYAQTGETGKGYWRRHRCFKGTPFHRIIPGFMCQGGDFNCGTGHGGESIYGQHFRSEKFLYRHSRRGLLSMALGRFRHTNNSQFFITFDECPWLDGKHVVFGHMLAGENTLKKIERQGTEGGGSKCKVEIYDCGELTESLIRTVNQDYEPLTLMEKRTRPVRLGHPLNRDPGPLPKSLWLKNFSR